MDASQQATMTPAEVALSPGDELDSPAEEPERKAKALADDFHAEFDAIVAAQESGALPPPPSPPTPQAAAAGFAPCRATLSEFFLKRSDATKEGEAARWSLHETLPGKGKDTELDKLVINLGLLDNRSCVASRWLERRKAQGACPPPVIEMSDNLDLKGNVSKLVSSEVIEKAMAETENNTSPRTRQGIAGPAARAPRMLLLLRRAFNQRQASFARNFVVTQSLELSQATTKRGLPTLRFLPRASGAELSPSPLLLTSAPPARASAALAIILIDYMKTFSKNGTTE